MKIKLIPSLKDAQRELKAAETRQRKSAVAAAKVQAFILRKRLQQELRQGMAGGKALDPLTEMAKRLKKGSKKPLSKLARGVFYDSHTKGKTTVIDVGFVGSSGFGKALAEIAKKQQEGFTQDTTELQKKFFYRFGRSLGKRARARKYFFLKPSTKHLKTPGREIIEPFWNYYRQATLDHVKRNYEKKMAGEKI